MLGAVNCLHDDTVFPCRLALQGKPANLKSSSHARLTETGRRRYIMHRLESEPDATILMQRCSRAAVCPQQSPSWHFYYIDSSQLSRVIIILFYIIHISTCRSFRSGTRTRGQACPPKSYRQARNVCESECVQRMFPDVWCTSLYP
jgi:hypothetical protein